MLKLLVSYFILQGVKLSLITEQQTPVRHILLLKGLHTRLVPRPSTGSDLLFFRDWLEQRHPSPVLTLMFVPQQTRSMVSLKFCSSPAASDAVVKRYVSIVELGSFKADVIFEWPTEDAL